MAAVILNAYYLYQIIYRLTLRKNAYTHVNTQTQINRSLSYEKKKIHVRESLWKIFAPCNKEKLFTFIKSYFCFCFFYFLLLTSKRFQYSTCKYLLAFTFIRWFTFIVFLLMFFSKLLPYSDIGLSQVNHPLLHSLWRHLVHVFSPRQSPFFCGISASLFLFFPDFEDFMISFFVHN